MPCCGDRKRHLEAQHKKKEEDVAQTTETEEEREGRKTPHVKLSEKQ